MTYYLGELAQSTRLITGLWALLLCLAGIVGIVLAAFVKRYRYAACSLIVLFPAYVLWQMNHIDLTEAGLEQAGNLMQSMGDFAMYYKHMLLIILTITAVLSIGFCIRYARTQITPLEIKRFADGMHCGISYWRNNGHIIFANDCINRLYSSMTGKPFLDGNSFREAARDGMISVDNRVWSCAFREIELDGELLHEVIATDITEIHAKSKMLKEDNEQLSSLRTELNIYGRKIDEIVRKQEILQAKIKIHEEMNRLMLSTVAADVDNTKELNRIFSLWQQNALILCMQADENKNKYDAEMLDEFAHALGIQLIWKNHLPVHASDQQLDMFFTAAKEAITNAVKHAEAKKMTISFTENQEELHCVFENDGTIPEGKIHFMGGLSNLQILMEEQKGFVTAEAGDCFRLVIHFLKEVH